MLSRALVILAFVTLVAKAFSSVKRDEEKRMHPDLAASNLRNVRINEEEYEYNYWKKQAQETLLSRKDNELNKNVAKNVIMFLGDGMSIGTLKGARILMGQQEGKDGENSQLAMEKFPYSGLSKTYCLNTQVPDSACTATAYLCGTKAIYGTLGVGGHVQRGDCAGELDESNHVDSIATWSQAIGKRTGIVTTTRITHASPAGTYAHSGNRDWEVDTELDDPACTDIAYQLIHGDTGKNFNVVLGGGRSYFFPNGTLDEEGLEGTREDGLDLISEWKNAKINEKAAYVYNKTGLFEAIKDKDYIMGLFEDDHMKYYLDSTEEDPTLEEMTEAAIEVLSRSENGYFLFVEGGRIDHGHHDNWAKRSLSETVELSKAIQKAKDMTSEEDTLIVVTSDHAHVFTISGYPDRGNDILGIADIGDDGIPFSTISYANGPGYRPDVNGVRYDFSKNDFSDKELLYPAMVPLDSETHSGEEVGIFASGPWAHLFTGVIEQNVIPHIMAYASCVGDGATACD